MSLLIISIKACLFLQLFLLFCNPSFAIPTYTQNASILSNLFKTNHDRLVYKNKLMLLWYENLSRNKKKTKKKQFQNRDRQKAPNCTQIPWSKML